jgi:mannose-6-phosphate isomerase-like protein (cupin superfamily)
METTVRPLVVPPAQGRALWHLGALLNFKALMSETGGQYWAVEGLADHHMAVPMHIHTQEDEVWFVLEGEITFIVDGETHTAGPGGFAYIPRGAAHSFQIKTGTARWFGVGLGGRLDQWFFETGQPAQSLTLPPPAGGPPSEAAIQAIVASLEAYGTETVGPPPG